MDEQRKDVFDRIVGLPGIRVFKPFYDKHREGILYIFFGGTTTLINLLLSAVFWYVLDWERLYVGSFALGTFLGNLISIVISIVYAYMTNRVWVFRSKTYGAKEIFKEFMRFVGGRLVTLVIEIGGVQAVTFMFPRDKVILFIGKIVTQVLVIVLNYVFSKVFVFKKRDTHNS